MKDTKPSITESDTESQVDEYFSTPCLSENAEPLSFWKNHQ